MKKPAVVSLSVHKNTKNRRRLHEISGDLMDCAKGLTRGKNIAGYAVVVWNEDLTTQAYWQTTGCMPARTVPEFVKQHMLEHMRQYRGDVDDDSA